MKKLNSKKKSIVITLVLCLSVLLACGASAVSKYDLIKEFAAKATTFDSKEKSTIDKEKEIKLKEKANKINERRNIALQDIKDTLKIDTQKYKLFDLDTLYGEDFKLIKDENVKTHIKDAINNAPIGSLKPFVLANEDGNEFIVAYKEEDGTNTMKKIFKQDGLWKTSAQSIKAKELKSIN